MDLVEKVIELAAQHGEESEPQMEVGDLQEALRIAWKVMSRQQRGQAFNEIRAMVFGDKII